MIQQAILAFATISEQVLQEQLTLHSNSRVEATLPLQMIEPDYISAFKSLENVLDAHGPLPTELLPPGMSPKFWENTLKEHLWRAVGALQIDFSNPQQRRIEAGFKSREAAQAASAAVARLHQWAGQPSGAFLVWSAETTNEASAVKPTPAIVPLSENEQAVLNEIPNGKEGAKTGKEILRSLEEKNIRIDQSVLTKRIIPVLKKNHRVKNRRNVGYYRE